MYTYPQTILHYLKDAGIAYIIEHGYSNTTPNQPVAGAGNIANYRITQFAIWIYKDQYLNANQLTAERESQALSSAYGQAIKNLVDGAAKAKQQKNTVSLSEELALTAINPDYYESNTIGVLGSGEFSTYTLSLTAPEGTEVYDEDGNVRKNFTFKKSEKFKLRIPTADITEATEIKVKVTANYQSKKIPIYDPSSATIQRALTTTLIPYDDPQALSASIVIPRATVKISKQDITNGEELAGSHLIVKDKETGTVIDEWDSDGTVHEIDGDKFENGKEYILHEDVAPNGYHVSQDVTFTYNVAQMDVIVMTDEKIVENPKTGTSFPYIPAGITLVLVVSGITVLNKKNKFKKI